MLHDRIKLHLFFFQNFERLNNMLQGSIKDWIYVNFVKRLISLHCLKCFVSMLSDYSQRISEKLQLLYIIKRFTRINNCYFYQEQSERQYMQNLCLQSLVRSLWLLMTNYTIRFLLTQYELGLLYPKKVWLPQMCLWLQLGVIFPKVSMNVWPCTVASLDTAQHIHVARSSLVSL